MVNIIGKKNIFLSIAGAFAGVSVLAVLMLGFNQGIDFAGGTLWQVRGGDIASSDDVRAFLAEADISAMVGEGEDGFIIRTEPLDEETHVQLLSDLRSRFGDGVEELSFQSIGPTIGEETRTRAVQALLLVLLAISLYIAFAFRKASRPVASWKYGVVTLATLFHDISIPAGLFALLGRVYGAEIDTNFVVALLVVLGFSVHDTIVVFDRIRERVLSSRGNEPFAELVNMSVNDTIARSINTSLTLIVVLVALFILGPASLYWFMLTLLVGVIAGTYSSIFIASPLLVMWYEKGAR